MSKILVAIPCYNCSLQIKRVISKFSKKLLDRIGGVVIIDNRSEDETIISAQKAIKQLNIQPEKFRIFKNDNNYNLGGSHKVAFNLGLEEDYDYVAILHGDDQAETLELHKLFDLAQKNPDVGAILGSRFMKGSQLKGYSFTRIAGNMGLNLIVSFFSLRMTKDLGSGLNLFKLSELKDKRYLGFADSLTFNINLLLDYYFKKTKLKFVPITWSETDQVSNAKIFKVGFTMLKTCLKWRLNHDSILKDSKEENRGYPSTQVS